MSNLPKLLPPIKAYEGAPLQIRLDMYVGFVNPGVTAEIYFNKVKKYEVPGVYNSGLNRVTIDFTADQIREMPLIADCRIRFGSNQYPLRAQIKPTSEGSSDGVVGYTISLSGDSYTVVEILGLDLVAEQVDIATEKATEASASAASSAEWAQSAGDFSATAATSATTATTQAGIATTQATNAGNSAAAASSAKTAAETARDQAQAAMINKMDTFYANTYALMQTFLATRNTPCQVLVLADENYGNLPRMHTWTGSVLSQPLTY